MEYNIKYRNVATEVFHRWMNLFRKADESMNAFLPADILFPQVESMEKWAVIACDQFTSDPAYWERVRKNAEGAPSTINLILPEAELGTEKAPICWSRARDSNPAPAGYKPATLNRMS